MTARKLLLLALALVLLLVSLPGAARDARDTDAASSCTLGRDVDRAFFAEVLRQLQDPPAPVRDFAVDSLMAWRNREVSEFCWNPLGTSQKLDGSWPDSGVKHYPDRATGVAATAITLNSNKSWAYYKPIREMLAHENFDEAAITAALNQWSNDGKYVPVLVAEWKDLYEKAPPPINVAGIWALTAIVLPIPEVINCSMTLFQDVSSFSGAWVCIKMVGWFPLPAAGSVSGTINHDAQWVHFDANIFGATVSVDATVWRDNTAMSGVFLSGGYLGIYEAALQLANPKTAVEQDLLMHPGDSWTGAFHAGGDSIRGEASVLGSSVTLRLTRPDGTPVQPGDPGVSIQDAGAFSSVMVIGAPAGNWLYTVSPASLDPAGEMVHLSIVEATPLAVDTVPPITTASLSGVGSNGWFRSDVRVSLEATDNPGGSGVADITYRVDDGSFSSYSAPFMVTGEGRHILQFYATDLAGNVEPMHSLPINIDMTAPVTTATLDPAVPNGERGWYISDVTVTLAASDPDLADGSPGSGVASTKYRVNGGAWEDYADPFVVGTEGWNQVDFYSTDVAGNVETAKNVRFKLDKTPPTVDINEGILDGLHWDQVHLERGILTNSSTLGLSGNATDNLCLWEVRAVDRDSGNTLASQQPPDPNQPDWPPPYPPSSLGYGLNVPLHTGINNIDVVAEDCAGWEKGIFIQIVYVVPGPYDPRTIGFWSEAVKTGKYTSAEMGTLLSYINVVSDTWGPAARNIYGLLTMSNYRGILTPVTSDMETNQKAQLLATWLNLVSGRVAVLTPADMTRVKGWSQVVDNTGGSPLTFALNVPMEIEEVDQTRLATRAVYQIAKNLAEAFNMRRIIP